jgi:hypothetical protein
VSGAARSCWHGESAAPVAAAAGRARIDIGVVVGTRERGVPDPGHVPVGLCVIALALRRVVDSRDECPRTLDLTGQALYMIAVGALAYAVIEGP